MSYLDGLSIFACFGKAAPDGGLDVRPTEGGHFAQLAGHLDAIVQQETQLALVYEPVGVCDEAEHVCGGVVSARLAARGERDGRYHETNELLHF